VSAVTEEAYRPPAPPPTTLQNVVLANLAVPIALIALPVILATGHAFNSWAIATGLWLVNRLIQQGVNRFIIGLPQTVAMGVAGVTFISRAWGVLIGLVLTVHFAGREVAIPAAILFAILYTCDMVARGVFYANSRRQDVEMRP
jgi:hypothetical protein